MHWQRGEQPFTDRKYSRAHVWQFDGGVTVPASSSPAVVRVPLSREDAVDPEEALIASLSSCHMLTFLDLAARAGLRIDDYRDAADGRDGQERQGQVVRVEGHACTPRSPGPATSGPIAAPSSPTCTTRRTRSASSPTRC